MRRFICASLLVVAVVGCTEKTAPAPSGSAATTAAASVERPREAAAAGNAAASASGTPSVPAVSAGAAGAASAWGGKYKSEAGGIPYAENWKVDRDGKQWQGGESSAGLGEGDLSIAIDPATHAVTGKVEGPLGPSTLAGIVVENRLTARLTPESPDQGFTGTLSATVGADSVDGELRASLPNASVLRKGTFALKRK